MKINRFVMDDKNETNEFLEDLANLSDDLKHDRKNKPTEIEDINIDDLIDDDDDIKNTEIQTEYDSIPTMAESKEMAAAKKFEESLPAPVQKPQLPATQPDGTSSSEEIQNYVLSQCQDIIQQGKATLEQLQDTVVNTCDGKAINGYATLLASLGKVLDTANAIGMEKSRIKSSIDMENLKHQHKTQMKASDGPVTKNTVNVIAGREEVMKMLAAMGEEALN